MKKTLFYALSLLFFISSACYGQKSNFLLPKVQQLETMGSFLELSSFKFYSTHNNQKFKSILEDGGFTFDNNSSIKFRVDIVEYIDVPLNRDEAYRLSIDDTGIYLVATTDKGVYWGIQTLIQLRDNNKIECCEILDWPAFRIRGFMQDVGRSYISIEELKKEIKKLSQYKINVFHWHLTENQAWRLESKKYPELTAAKNMTRMPGLYYTLDEARELVEFCKKHQVMLIPEIDMPGHSAAFERAFCVDMQSSVGMEILKDILDEVCDVFDVPYIHIGTDEVEFTNPTFVPEMVEYIRKKGKMVISWNPGWNYKVGEIDMTQLWSYRGKAQKGIPAIDCRFHYINHFDTFADLFSLYNSRIYNVDHGSDDIAGAIIAIWNDRLLNSEENIVLENHLYPTMLALAERAWLGGGNEYFNKLGTVLPVEKTSELLEFIDFENRLLYHKKNNFMGYPFAYVKQTHVKWAITDPFPNGGDLSKAFPPEDTIQNSYTYNGSIYNVNEARGAGIYLRHVWGDLVPAFYDNAKEYHTAYAYTWIYSPYKQEVGLWLETQNYSRSEKDLPPHQGTWDYRGSKIWFNDLEVKPPLWTSTHTVKSNEIALGNENMVSRNPIPITLNKGWNKLMLKLPVGRFEQNEIRLVKWMFSAILVTLDGKDAIDSVIYSPTKNRK
ncbi:MAG: family 20 glycosylhydrolase [Bacteroides sp.]